jgi:hypothetical protein
VYTATWERKGRGKVWSQTVGEKKRGSAVSVRVTAARSSQKTHAKGAADQVIGRSGGTRLRWECEKVVNCSACDRRIGCCDIARGCLAAVEVRWCSKSSIDEYGHQGAFLEALSGQGR